jgi:hypothetical protein
MKEYAGFIPKQDGKRTIWLANYIETIVRVGAALGLTAAEITEQVDAAQAWIDSINNAEIKRTRYGDAIGEKKRISRESQDIIGAAIGRLKRHIGYTEAIGRHLGAIDLGQTVDLGLLKPAIKPVAERSHVRIAFKKRGMASISIYSRMNGAGNWVWLGYSVISPFIDSRPVAEGKAAEVREYMAVCIHHMEEVGLQSGIEEVVFAG